MLYSLEMPDPLSQVIALLRPRTVFAKGISGAGRWAVRYSAFGRPSFCTVLEGACMLAVDGQQTVTLSASDFVLLPATPAFTLSGFDPAEPILIDPDVAAEATGEVRHGRPDSEPDVRLLGGYFAFDSPDAGLLEALLPPLVHLRGAGRLQALVRLVGEEARTDKAGRDLILSRLVEVLLVEALRAAPGEGGPPGMLAGLAEPRLAVALRQIHGDPARAWTVAELAQAAALSRSVFFERFARVVGTTPMDYLLGWRMALAKDLLRQARLPLAEIADRIGYGSASAFSLAFKRHAGVPPARYAAMVRTSRS